MKYLSAVVAPIFVPVGAISLYHGVDFFGTPWWGYQDNSPGVYFVVGSIYALLGLLVMVVSSLFVWRTWTREG